ncbi:class II aldolase/adducin family protein [Domibacillus enclensis]|uniref:Aldolase n=1 Tax=Domibacillus enclensis TaxID=1017273 RepID=A0A1N6V469_9BACI|nr:class II aldolase/adducin family protein [Domibacillus enclensis]OXS78693.1 aldolase [Domibacillus enclensis]SIQ72610.1 L-fuculose-phosphate aldolase [Domibacillus enclensis]
MNSINELIHAAKYMIDHQLAWGTSGNVSVRQDDQHMLITASGTKMAELTENDFVQWNIQTNEASGVRKASKETPMHSGIYVNRPDARVILHSSPFYTTLFACSQETIVSELFIETMYYLEDIAYVDYFHPGTTELGEAVAEQSLSANIVMMRNHGVVVFDDSISDALMRLETLEMACRMIAKAKECGIALTKIPDQVVSHFLEDSRYKPRKKGRI